MATPFRLAAGAAAGAISAVAFVPYLVDVVRGKTRPSATTWFLWTGVGALLCASYWASGARASIWVAASFVLGPLVTALVALRHGDRAFSRFDKGCVLVSALSVGLWVRTGNPLFALGLNVVVDLLGAMPTMRNVWRDPSAESHLAWALFFTGNALNLFAVEAWTLSGAAYPVYLFLMTLSMNVGYANVLLPPLPDTLSAQWPFLPCYTAGGPVVCNGPLVAANSGAASGAALALRMVYDGPEGVPWPGAWGQARRA